jgi:predicted Zn-dependent peptidase
MIPYHRFFLQNGLEVIIHQDLGSKMAVFNLLYKVGSKNEAPGKTGLAHFFEHLMFGSSANVPVFDRELERVGGACNAFTSPDITNYYITLPAANIETAFWLESDRMLQLSLSEKTIETQRKVVLEEYKQRYLNQPYGDAFHHLRDLAFDNHPYKWPTIGQKPADIENFTRTDVTDFYEKNYQPGNAILVIAGAVDIKEMERLTNKWFGDIPNHGLPANPISRDGVQQVKRTKLIQAKVPTDALFKAYRMPAKLEDGYLEADLITDLLGSGKSSILEQTLIKNGKHFASIGAYILGSVDPGLLIFSGKMEQGVSSSEGEAVLDQVVSEFLTSEITDLALQKIKNQGVAMKTYESIKLINRAMNLAYYAHLGDPDLYYKEFEKKSELTKEAIRPWANQLIQEGNASVLHYQSLSS